MPGTHVAKFLRIFSLLFARVILDYAIIFKVITVFQPQIFEVFLILSLLFRPSILLEELLMNILRSINHANHGLSNEIEPTINRSGHRSSQSFAQANGPTFEASLFCTFIWFVYNAGDANRNLFDHRIGSQANAT